MSRESAETSADVIVVGAGLVGLATALALGEEHGARALVLEAEPAPARHQSGRNSGVIHSGLYYQPGSAKAALCVEGRRRMEAFCAQEDVPRAAIGKLVVAVVESELDALAELLRRGRLNGLKGLEVLDAQEVASREPHIRAVKALWVPETSVTDFRLVAAAMVRRLERAGGSIRTAARVTAIREQSGNVEVDTALGTFRAAALVVCAGLQADRLARLAGIDPGVSIVPFRGAYRELCGGWRAAVRSLIYPVPDPRYPFLGVHLTPTIDGRLLAGPGAMPALARDADRVVDARDALDMLGTAGFWRFAFASAPFAAGQARMALSDRSWAREVGRLMPAVTAGDLSKAPGGVRAQAMTPQGELVDDFLVRETARTLHVLNAPSPAATASLAIGSQLAARAAALL